MARPDDEYWTKSNNKGFNFDTEDFPQVNFYCYGYLVPI